MEGAPACSPAVLAAVVNGPLTPQAEAELLDRVGAGHSAGLAGAVLRFEGVVRRNEVDQARGGTMRALAALDYQTYDPMAGRQLGALARAVAERHGLFWVAALHSRGRVGVGQVSFVLIVAGAHRAEAIAALTEFIDRLKQEVPIWKRPVWAHK